jgi:hypothetical protein
VGDFHQCFPLGIAAEIVEVRSVALGLEQCSSHYLTQNKSDNYIFEDHWGRFIQAKWMSPASNGPNSWTTLDEPGGQGGG